MIEYILVGLYCIGVLGFLLYYLFVVRFFRPYPKLDEDITNSHATSVDDALDGWLGTATGSRKTMGYLKESKQWKSEYYKKLNRQFSLLGRLRFRRYIKIKVRGKENAFTFTLIHNGREFIREGNIVTEEWTRNEIDKQTYSEEEIITRIKQLHHLKGDGLFKYVNRSDSYSHKKHQRKHTHRNKRRAR